MIKFLNLFKKSIKIPLTTKGKETGQWIECVKGDETYQKLIKLYGIPLPKQIEVEPLK
jgi:hypothetical protein